MLVACGAHHAAIHVECLETVSLVSSVWTVSSKHGSLRAECAPTSTAHGGRADVEPASEVHRGPTKLLRSQAAVCNRCTLP